VDGPPGGTERGLNSTFTSFNGSRAGSPSMAGLDGDISPEASGSYRAAHRDQLLVALKQLYIHQQLRRALVQHHAKYLMLLHLQPTLSTIMRFLQASQAQRAAS
jgi:hypothetical protein